MEAMHVPLVGQCSDMRRFKATHALFLTHGLLHRNPFALSRLILLISSTSLLDLSYASLLFHHSPTPPNSFAFNTLIRAHSRSPQPRHALSFFLLMLRSHSAPPDHHTFPFALSACAAIPCLPSGKQIHSLVSKNGLASADHFVQTALLRLYVQNSNDDDFVQARRVFDEIPRRDAVHWDVLMNGYLRCDRSSKALCLFHDLLLSGLEPDEYTITTALTACAHAGALEQGVWIHKFLEKKKGQSFFYDTYIGTALVNMYSKCGCITEAVRVFDEMPVRNTFVWSAMIGGFAMHGFSKEAMHCLVRMQEADGLRPDGVVLLGALTACAHAGLVDEGLHLLADMETRYGVVPKHEHYSCTIDLLCRVGRLEEAVGLVRQMPMRPLASVWGSVLTGCRIYGNVELAEVAVGELQTITMEDDGLGDDEGVYVQLSNIYLNANRWEDARKVRKLIGCRGIKKTPAYSVIEVDGKVNSFVAGDQVHPLRLEICKVLDLLMDHTSSQSLHT